jgi:hypothetical protein
MEPIKHDLGFFLRDKRFSTCMERVHSRCYRPKRDARGHADARPCTCLEPLKLTASIRPGQTLPKRGCSANTAPETAAPIRKPPSAANHAKAEGADDHTVGLGASGDVVLYFPSSDSYMIALRSLAGG